MILFLAINIRAVIQMDRRMSELFSGWDIIKREIVFEAKGE